MSTLVSINLHTLGCRRSSQKRSAKLHDDPEELRHQRVLYENYLRKNKREKLLESKRKVLEKINWTVAWSDDEDDTEEGQVNVEELVRTIVDLESSIKPLRLGTIVSLNDHVTNLNNLSHALDVCRRKLHKEVALTLSTTARYRKPVPGVLATTLSRPPLFEVIFRLLVNSNSSPNFAACGLTIARQVTAILVDLTRFELAIETLVATSSCHFLVGSLQKILRNDRMDVVCFYNSFNILNHIVSSKQLQSALDFKTLFDDVLFHLTRALTKYGPEDNIINLYIKSMTQLLVTVVRPLLKESWFIEDQNFCAIFEQILSVLESLFNLNDADVALNVMKVIAIVSETHKGLQILVQRQNLISIIFATTESSVDWTSEKVPLKVVAVRYEVIANMVEANKTLCIHFANPRFFDQAYHAIRINDCDIEFNVFRILLSVIRFEPQTFDLFFERKLTENFSSIFFMSENRTQAKLLDIVHELSSVATPEQGLRMLKSGFISCTENHISCSDHGHQTTHKVLEIHRNLLLKSVKGDFLDEAIEICSSIESHLERLLRCKNEFIVGEAIRLLEEYFDPPPSREVGLESSPTSRVH